MYLINGKEDNSCPLQAIGGAYEVPIGRVTSGLIQLIPPFLQLLPMLAACGDPEWGIPRLY